MMSGFLHRLAARTLGAGAPVGRPVVQPMVPSVFANGGTTGLQSAVVPEQPGGERRREANATAPSQSAEIERAADPRSTPDTRGALREAVHHDLEPRLLPHAAEEPVLRSLVPPVLVPIAAPAPPVVTAPGGFGLPAPATRAESGNLSRAATRRNPDAPVHQPPTVRVTIGRIDVRAEFPPAAPARQARQSPSPALSLDQYQRQRDGGLR